MNTAFISYAKEDIAKARMLYAYINSDTDFKAWLDEEALLPGMNWEAEIMNAIQEANAILLVISQNSINKTGYVQKELNTALERLLHFPKSKIFLIPVLIEDCCITDPRLKQIQHVKIYESWEKGIKQIEKSLKLVSDANSKYLKLHQILYPNDDSDETLDSHHGDFRLSDYDVNRILKSTRDFSNCNLSNLDLGTLDLSSVNFKGSNLIGVNLQKANLANSDFSFSNMERADLREANIKESTFFCTNFWGAKLTRVKNLESAKSCELINIYNLRDSSYEEHLFNKISSKVLYLSDYRVFIDFYCRHFKINYARFIMKFPWMDSKRFVKRRDN